MRLHRSIKRGTIAATGFAVAMALAGVPEARAQETGGALLGATPLILKDGRIAEVSIHVVAFPPGASEPAERSADELAGLTRGAATDCFLTAQVIGHVGPDEVEGSDTLSAHRLARARADAIQASLIDGGLPAKAIASVWDWQFMVREPRATLWLFQLVEGEDCEGRPLEGAAPLVAEAESEAERETESGGAAAQADTTPPRPEPESRETAAQSDTASARPEAESRDATAQADTATARPEPESRETAAEAATGSGAGSDGPSQATLPAGPAPAALPGVIRPLPAGSEDAATPGEGEPAATARADGETATAADEPAVDAAEAQPEAPARRKSAANAPDRAAAADTDGPATAAAEPETSKAGDGAAEASDRPTAAERPATEAATAARQPASPDDDRLAITFANNSSYFPPGAGDGLAALVDALQAGGGRHRVLLEVSVSGSTKVVGADSAEQAMRYNRWLATRRRDRVLDWLQERVDGAAVDIETEFVEDDDSRQVVVKVSPTTS